MRKKQDERNITENPLYHDTWKLAEEVQGCGMEPGAVHSTGAKSV